MVLYFVSLKVVGYFHRQNELGIILSLKIFQMSWIILFAMLIFSCMVTSVSTIFLSRDNEIVFASPVTPPEMYFMRYLTNTIYTSWMMVVFSLPIFAAYGVVFRTDFYYWPLMIVTVFSTAAGATCFGLLLTVILVNLFPARRTKDIVLYLSLCFGIFIYLMIRLLRPEEMINPDNYSHFIDYLSSISKPAAPLCPQPGLQIYFHYISWTGKLIGCSWGFLSQPLQRSIFSANGPCRDGFFQAIPSHRNRSGDIGGSAVSANIGLFHEDGYLKRKQKSLFGIRPNGRSYL